MDVKNRSGSLKKIGQPRPATPGIQVLRWTSRARKGSHSLGASRSSKVSVSPHRTARRYDSSRTTSFVYELCGRVEQYYGVDIITQGTNTPNVCANCANVMVDSASSAAQGSAVTGCRETILL